MMIATLAKTVARPKAVCRPLLPLQGVMSITSQTKAEVLGLIEEGKLLWAWDLTPKGNDSRRKLLRVLPSCVDSFVAGRDCQIQTLEDAISLVIPDDDRPLRAVDVYRALNVTETFLYNRLIRGKELRSTGWKTGPLGSAKIERESIVRFLMQRRYPFH